MRPEKYVLLPEGVSWSLRICEMNRTIYSLRVRILPTIKSDTILKHSIRRAYTAGAGASPEPHDFLSAIPPDGYTLVYYA